MTLSLFHGAIKDISATGQSKNYYFYLAQNLQDIKKSSVNRIKG